MTGDLSLGEPSAAGGGSAAPPGGGTARAGLPAAGPAPKGGRAAARRA